MRSPRRLVLLLAAVPAGALVAFVYFLAVLAGGQVGALAGAGPVCAAPAPPAPAEPASARALREIPASYLSIYHGAGRDLDIDWRFLAAVGAVTSNHGRRPEARGSGVGPMRLTTDEPGCLVCRFGLDADGDDRVDAREPTDAIYTAANALRRGSTAPARGGSFAAYEATARRHGGERFSREVMDRAVSYGLPREPAGSKATKTPTLVGGPDAGVLDLWMERTVPGSPLSNLGQAFVFEGEAHGVDPRLLVAVALQESRLGTQGSGAGRHNAFGLGPGIAYLTWQAGIAAAARTIASYARDGLSTIAQIQTRWAPVGASNDPTGLNAGWSAGVSRTFAELGGDPGAPVAGDRLARGADPGGPGCHGAGPDPGGVRARIVAILQEEVALGLREDGGEDRGPPLLRYWGSEGIPWCAAFATWVWRRAGVPIPRYAHSRQPVEWAKANTRFTPIGAGVPEPGDAVTWSDGSADTDHIDIVERVLPNGYLVLVGGNVSDAVTRKAPLDPAGVHGGRRILGYSAPISPDGALPDSSVAEPA